MTDASAPSQYRVLARKYRPTSFSGLVGQEALVRTLTNALESGRLAHAFILTGVRGVGKTTTARIIARALNCVGPDGEGEPVAEPCGVCEHCVAISEDRHMDVIEMDAASRTGVDDIRELIDGVRYAPTSARYKVYIIDEVHMLSRNAFNALLKTLEEPPPHVKFIFATTEVRKIPLTVLSRCQRFDLRRVDAETLIRHFGEIAEQEEVSVEPEALALIVRAAEGSVRDGLSLLDQAIAHGAGSVTVEQVRDMLGLADRARVLDLFEAVMGGEIARALDLLGEQYAAGADPVAVLQDMVELSHWLTRVKLTPESAEEITVPEEVRKRGRALAETLTTAVLARVWQMLLKGLEETRRAHSPLAAAEMALVRLAFASDLPTPAELVRDLRGAEGRPSGTAPAAPGAGVAPPPQGAGAALKTEAAVERRPEPDPPPRPRSSAQSSAEPSPHPPPVDFAGVLALAEAHRDGVLRARLMTYVHLVRFEPGRIEFRPAEGAPRDLASQLSEKLGEWTGERWMVTISDEAGTPTLGEQTRAREDGRRAEAEEDPLVRAVLATFPGAELREVRDIGPAADGDGEDGARPESEPQSEPESEEEDPP